MKLELEQLEDIKSVIIWLLENGSFIDLETSYNSAMNSVNTLDEAINYIRCCETLKNKEETAFDLWLKNFKHAERDLYWYNEDTLYCIEAMKDIYNTEVKPTL